MWPRRARKQEDPLERVVTLLGPKLAAEVLLVDGMTLDAWLNSLYTPSPDEYRRIVWFRTVIKWFGTYCAPDPVGDWMRRHIDAFLVPTDELDTSVERATYYALCTY